jgi:hypothetical protein
MIGGVYCGSRKLSDLKPSGALSLSCKASAIHYFVGELVTGAGVGVP